MTGWYAERTPDRSAKVVIAVTLLALLLVAAVPVALLAGVVMMLLGHVVGGLALFGGSILAAAIAVAVAGMSGMRHLRKLVAGRSFHVVQLDGSQYTDVAEPEGVAAPGRRGPPEGAVGELIDRPPRLLLEPVVMPALRTPITQARPPARLVRRVVLEVALAGGPPADGAGAGGVPDLGQVPERDPGSWPRASCRCSQSRVSRVSIATIRPGPPPGMRSRQVPYPPGGPSRLAGVKQNPAPPGGGPGPERLAWLLGSGRPQPWPTAWPCLSVTVTHQVVFGFRAAAVADQVIPRALAVF